VEGSVSPIKRALFRFKDENMTDWAAALTYFAVLSLFPALIVVVALVGVLGKYPETTDKLLQIVSELGPETAVETFRSPIEQVIQNNGGAGALLGFGLLGALWSASAYIAAFMRASDAIYEVSRERRPIRKLSVRLGLTVVMAVLLAVIAVALVVTGPLAEAIGSGLGLRRTVLAAWSIGKWPVLVLLTAVALTVLYFGSPNVRQHGIRPILPGGLLAVAVWIVASIGFAFFVANFGSYDKVYGTLSAVIIMLIWLYVSNMAIVFGALFNAERLRGELADREIPIDLRDEKGKPTPHARTRTVSPR
jgi:membrane protein